MIDETKHFTVSLGGGDDITTITVRFVYKYGAMLVDLHVPSVGYRDIGALAEALREIVETLDEWKQEVQS